MPSAHYNLPDDHDIFDPEQQHIAIKMSSKVFRIIGITGSLRKDSWNTKLLRAYEQACKDEEFASQGVQFEFADWSKYYPPPNRP